MKIVLATFAVLLSLNSSAQESPKHEFRKHEIGIGYRIPSNSSGAGGGIDLMYKNQRKENKFYRFLIGFQSPNTTFSQKRYSAIGDTIMTNNNSYNYTTLFVGFGLQIQRHFYKRVFLTAAVDTRFHYGGGTYDNYYVKIFYDADNLEKNDYTKTKLAAISAFQWDLQPSIGAKFEFSRVNFGIELTALLSQFYSLHSKTSAYSSSLFDFDLGNNLTRAFIGFRF